MGECPEFYTTFNGVSQYGETLLSSELEVNLKSFLDWGFLCIGAWTNVEIPTSGAWGGVFHKARLVDDPAYTLGTVWETPRQDWIYETGLCCYTGGTPISISGVYVNGTFYGTGDAVYGHHYNYPLGRIVFDSPRLTTDTITLEYSYRNIQVFRADEAPWWQELQYNSTRVDDPSMYMQSSGNWAIIGNHRVQMPAVVLEVVPRRRFKGYELGNNSLIVYQDMLFHILAQTRWERNQLIDIISFQNDKTIWLYNSDSIATAEVGPLDYRGMLVPNSLMYPAFVNLPYRWKRCTFTNTVISEVESYNPMFHEGIVRTTFELIW
jgi:hypothetical protein